MMLEKGTQFTEVISSFGEKEQQAEFGVSPLNFETQCTGLN